MSKASMKLKPCPFCGSKSVQCFNTPDYRDIFCWDCRIAVSDPDLADMKSSALERLLAARWNRRPRKRLVIMGIFFFALGLLVIIFGCQTARPEHEKPSPLAKYMADSQLVETLTGPCCQACPRDRGDWKLTYQVEACWDRWPACMVGPGEIAGLDCSCLFDLDADEDVDLVDMADVQNRISP